MQSEAKIYVTLADGVCAEVLVRVVEQGLPTPHEACTIREPGITELDAIAGKLSAKDYRSAPPFEIVRPTWPKPIPRD